MKNRGGPNVVVGGKLSRPKPNSSLSFAQEEESSSGTSSSKGIRPLALPQNLDQANIHGGSSNHAQNGSQYSAEALADLKATTRSLSTTHRDGDVLPLDEDGNPVAFGESGMQSEPTAYQTLEDPTASTLTRHFGADHLDVTEGSVPSQSVIEAAKERRRRAAAAASNGNGNHETSDDFVPLETSKSRSLAKHDASHDGRGDQYATATLQREEDEIGSGEEEFAEFTGAKEQMLLDAGRRRKHEAQVRKDQQEQMAADSRGFGDLDDEEDDEEDEFELAQMRRMEGTSASRDRKQQQHREKSPYQAAPLPPIAPLPGMSTVSSHISSRLAELEGSRASHEKIVEDATRTLTQLEEEEVANKESVMMWSDKDAWARELAEFIESLATLLEEKWPLVQAIEDDFLDLHQQRSILVQKIRAREMEDELSLFWGVPRKTILPASQKPPSEEADDMDLDGGSHPKPREDEDDAPAEDGDATSVTRTQRRESGAVPANQAATVIRDIGLKPEDAAAFDVALEPIKRKWESILDGVKAPEFRWPDARASGEGDHDRGVTAADPAHPSSVHSRFLDWRRRFPEEYSNAWGGLALAGVWEFWAKRELALWHPTRPTSESKALQDLESSACLQAVQHYSEASTGLSEDGVTAIGGDDEAVASLVNTIFLPRLLAAAKTYDPWSSEETARILKLCSQVADFIPKSGLRFQGLAKAYLDCFENHITHIESVLAAGPAIAAPGFHPLAIPARLAFITRLLAPPAAGGSLDCGLLFNLFRFTKVCVGSVENLRLIQQMADVLISTIGWELLRQSADIGGRRLAASILERLPREVPLEPELRNRLQMLASSQM